MGSISHHITPLVISSLKGGHTHTCKHTHTHTHTRIQTFADRSNSKKPGTLACGWRAPGLKIISPESLCITLSNYVAIPFKPFSAHFEANGSRKIF